MKSSHSVETLPSSFRDPSGFLFLRDGVLYRQVNQAYREDWKHLIESGLYGRLTEEGFLVNHDEVKVEPARPETSYKIIRPERLPFISYPYEWSFSQLQDAALLTLDIQKVAIQHGMSLKDASAFNVQFVHCNPVLIDTLSFERYQEGRPWVAYRQFCQHFLAPLALAAKRDFRLTRLSRLYLDGIPLDLASGLLPRHTHFSFGLKIHIHLHSQSQRSHANRPLGEKTASRKFSKQAFLGFNDSLRSTVLRLKWNPPASEWGDYYQDTNYSEAGLSHKLKLIDEFVSYAGEPGVAWDFGANDGRFSRVISKRGWFTISADIDPVAVEKNWRGVKRNQDENLMPLWLDLTNPTPPLGWTGAERDGFNERCHADLAIALALVHHLAIGNNLPLERIASFFASHCKQLIFEWVPKEDSQVQRLLATREDIFDQYTQANFERAFSQYFEPRKKVQVRDSKRLLYLMENVA